VIPIAGTLLRMGSAAFALAEKLDPDAELIGRLRKLGAEGRTCSESAFALGIRPGFATRLALDNNIAFGGVNDMGAWPRRGAPPPPEWLSPPRQSTMTIFEKEARRRGTDGRRLAARMLDVIASQGLFAAILDR
jgi:hypothetical protein